MFDILDTFGIDQRVMFGLGNNATIGVCDRDTKKMFAVIKVDGSKTTVECGEKFQGEPDKMVNI